MIKNSTFPPNEIKYEKLVVADELIGRNEDPRVILKEILYKNLYDITVAVTQNKDFLRNFSREQILDIYRQFYVPERLIVAVVGKIKKEKALKIIKRHFERLRGGVLVPLGQKSKKPFNEAKRIIVKKGGLKHAHLMMGFEIPTVSHDDYYSLLILQAIIAGNIASRLFEQLRERRGLLYDITAKLDCSAWHGIFRLYTNFSPPNLRTVEAVIKNEFKKLRKRTISDEELKTAKLKLIRERRLSLEGTLQYARLLVETEINNRLNDWRYFTAQINKVKTEDVLKAAKRYCNLNKSLTVILKPRAKRAA